MSADPSDTVANLTEPEDRNGQEHPPESSAGIVRWIGGALILETLFAGLMLYLLLHM